MLVLQYFRNEITYVNEKTNRYFKSHLDAHITRALVERAYLILVHDGVDQVPELVWKGII